MITSVLVTPKLVKACLGGGCFGQEIPRKLVERK